MANVPLHPKHPERVCWGCDKYCRADALDCGNGTVRTQHPVEIFGEDWLDWSADSNTTEKVHDPSELVQLNTSTIGV
jgi:hypothetical protein